MLDNQVSNQAQPAGQKPYLTPQLTTFGLIRDITAAGTGSLSETLPGGGSGMNTMRHP